MAAGKLEYNRVELHKNKRDVEYIFDDPLQVGDELQRRYAGSAFPLVHAKTLADARGFLADEHKRILKGAGIAKR